MEMTKLRPDGTTKVTCWCESEIVEVLVEDVAKGLTKPCYQQKCKDMDKEMRTRT